MKSVTKEEALERFRTEICRREDEVDPEGECDWYDLSIGFFIGIGVKPLNAHEYACEARYVHEYWNKK